jgi:hypothetical protein
MPSPLNDPRTPEQIAAANAQVSGAPPAAPGQQLGAPPGGSLPQYDIALQQDEALRRAALMNRLGLGTPQRQRSVWGGAVGGTLGQLFDPWMQTQGIGGGDVSNLSGLLDQFVSRFQDGGGGLASVAGDARNAAAQALGNPAFAGLKDPELIAMLKAFGQLGNITSNDWLQRAYGGLQDDSVFDLYSQIDQAARGGLDPASVNYLDVIQQNPLYGFLTGR